VQYERRLVHAAAADNKVKAASKKQVEAKEQENEEESEHENEEEPEEETNLDNQKEDGEILERPSVNKVADPDTEDEERDPESNADEGGEQPEDEAQQGLADSTPLVTGGKRPRDEPDDDGEEKGAASEEDDGDVEGDLVVLDTNQPRAKRSNKRIRRT
jgi:hypothetical protein